MRVLIAVVLSLILALPAAAQVFRFERFVLRVFPVTSTTVEVLLDDFAGPTEVWCVAAAYADQVLGHSRAGDLWLQSSLAPSPNVPGRRSVVFSIEPITPEVQVFSFSLRSVGARRSMATAQTVCQENRSQVYVRLPGGQLLRAD